MHSARVPRSASSEARPSRRQWLRGAAAFGAAASASLSPLVTLAHGQTRRVRGHSLESVAQDETFWRPIQDAWPVDRSLINLNNGGVSPSPFKTQETLRRLTEFANQAPAYNMWRIQEPQKENVRRGLASLFGADAEEIAIVRNASEALQIATFGIELNAGDEVLSTSQDYPRMVSAWRQREQRDGIVFTQLPMIAVNDPPSDLVRRFEAAITERTKVIHVCHATYTNGRFLPVREICALARRKGILSIVDGAHAFAHMAFNGVDIGCDYYGTSLHKWLAGPVGAGMLYVRREQIAKTWPLMAHSEPRSEDIRKFEQFGTHPVPIFLAVEESLHFHEAIGPERKEARLRFLRDTWWNGLKDLPGVIANTPLDPAQSCGITNVGLESVASREVGSHLQRKHRILATPIDVDDFQGTRISPNLYTTRRELDRFVAAMRTLATEGLPG